MWDANRAAWCCAEQGRGCPLSAPVLQETSDPTMHCFGSEDASPVGSRYFGWSDHKKGWCCERQGMGCPGTWHGSYHISTHMVHGVGHAHGRIYDCNAGFSNWMQGWSDSKKDWCCKHNAKGCQKFHCSGSTGMWAADKREWCCANFQKACPRTTLSNLKCDALCRINGEDSKCIDRIHWVANHVFGSKDNKCALAYSKIQVDCDICRGCSIQDAGCEVQAAGRDPFDCNAALNNFFRAWSPEKKQWCCTKRGKGCEGKAPPSVDAGAGMVWKHVQVNGYWTWQAVQGHGVVSAPYDCHAGARAYFVFGFGHAGAECYYIGPFRPLQSEMPPKP
ncbi:Uncharacterized protein SCF082_LOCUS42070 [Durusdinium trenchii]|uniref:Uncharacterized protein n=1 Tax=Durusdinium trenchii TaxID=1381693 RepID=A0ABP0QLI2_9DINO